MKNYFLLLLCLVGIIKSEAQNRGFSVTAKISNPQQYTLALVYYSSNTMIIDTNAVVRDGAYIFKGNVDAPVLANLIIRGADALSIKTKEGIIPGPSLTFFLLNDDIKITGAADKIYMSAVEGGLPNKEWAGIRAEENKWEDEIWQLMKRVYENGTPGSDSIEMKKLIQVKSEQDRRLNTLHQQFIENNPSSIVSAYFLAGMVNTLNVTALKSAYGKLGDDSKHTLFGQMIEKKIAAMDASSTGMQAIAIDKKDSYGNPVNLQTLKGKYVLLDFWGSWCAPCRQSHPYLTALYAKYHSRGLEILGIAQEQSTTLSECRTEWLNAIQKDKLVWPQVLNNEESDKFNAVAAYGITAFPTKILLDKDGKIVARFIGTEHEQLDDVLKNIFNK
ncbi:redoxin family protein [Chitinophaga sp. 30R24]|uniref:redoxin family protein n=1 Tax=Chitinophaga sp. 30R24 TaxID=3248838 RepID=UPI003B8F27E4